MMAPSLISSKDTRIMEHDTVLILFQTRRLQQQTVYHPKVTISIHASLLSAYTLAHDWNALAFCDILRQRKQLW